MCICSRVLVLIAALSIAGAALAQEPKAWLGANVADVTKADADKLGWDSPHGVKLGLVASGAPADNAGLKADDIIDLVDGSEVETSSAFEKTISAKSPGAEIRMRVLSGGRERRVTVTLADRPIVQAAQDTDLPLMLDTGGHMAPIRDLAFTPDGKQLVSAGDDKVIRIWDWQAGKTVRTIRGQVGSDLEGTIYAMALSPDGRWLAVGGVMGPVRDVDYDDVGGRVRLYDFATGIQVALLKGHTNTVISLAFSANGKRLISGSTDKTAIIWDVENHKLVHRLSGHKAGIRSNFQGIFAVAFTPDEARAVTGSSDTTLKLWSVEDGKEIATLTGHGFEVRSLAIAPRDGTIASGGLDGEIRLWDGRTGQYLRTLANQGTPVVALRFYPDGKRLLSSSDQRPIVWDVASGDRLQELQHDNGYTIAISSDGKLAATGGGIDGQKMRVWELATGTLVKGPEGKPLVLGGTGVSTYAAGFSADGQRIAWGITKKSNAPTDLAPLDLQLWLPSGTQGLGRPERVNADAAAANGFIRARLTHGTYTLVRHPFFTDDSVIDLKKDGATLVSIERGRTEGYKHIAYSFTPDGQTIISGGYNGQLAAFDLKGHWLGNFVGHESEVWAVAPSPDGRLLVSGSDDQTVRLWNLKTRELIVTLFRGSDGEWVMWTPQGYYTGSEGADRIVGWQINKGPEHEADYVGAEQLRSHLNRPDIVNRAIILASAEQAVREAPGTTFTLTDLLARPAPKFRIVSPAADALQHGGHATVTIAVERTPDPLKVVRVYVNGRLAEQETPDAGAGILDIHDVPLARGKNEVRITLTNVIGEKAETLTLMHDGEGDLDKRGTLYILGIGVDKYPGLGKKCGKDGKASCDLSFAGADARAVVAAVEQRLKRAHTKVVKRLLYNGAKGNDEPNAANIRDAIDKLKQANKTDTVLLFIAGHGFNEESNYRFLATNAERQGESYRSNTVVPWYELQEAVETAKGRRILFIDTCHGANAYNPTNLTNALYHADIIAYTASRFDQSAREDANLGHGLFTYAVVEGLEGKGGIGAKRQISTNELADYVKERVEELAKTRQWVQEPQYFKGPDAQDYVLATW